MQSKMSVHSVKRWERESPTLEYKGASVTFERVSEVVASFLNSGGGRLLIGLSDDGTVEGIKDPDTYASNLNQYLLSSIRPRDSWSVSVEKYEGSSLIAVDVPSGAMKPYVVHGKILTRRGTQSVLATADEISSLIDRRESSEERWERQPALGIDLANLDQTEILRTRDFVASTGRLKNAEPGAESGMEQLGLYREGSLTNAAVVLYGITPARYFPQVRARFTVYENDKGGTVFEADHILEGNLFENAAELEKLLRPYADEVRSTFPIGTWQRQDRPRYPMAALREGIMNALIHRDYSAPSGGVTVGVYPHRIDIWNFGQLPKEISPQDLRGPHPSLPRNPDIAHVCFLHGLIEKVGRGTQKIIEECRNAGLKSPRWESKDSGTTLTFFAPNVSSLSNENELSERQLKIIDLLKTYKSLRAAQISELLSSNLTSRTIRTDLLSLVDHGRVVRQGKGPSTVYTLAANQES